MALHNKSGRYRARITSTAGDGRQRALGYFETKELAALAWDKAAREIGFAPELLNFPDKEEAKAAAADQRYRGVKRPSWWRHARNSCPGFHRRFCYGECPGDPRRSR